MLPLTAETLTAVWHETLARIGPFLASALRNKAQPAIFGPNALVIQFPGRYNDDYGRCQEPANVAKLEEGLRKITGQACKVRFEILTPATAPSATTTPVVADAETAQARSRRQKLEAEQIPLLKSAMDLLGAEVLEKPDGFGAAPTDNGEPPRTEPIDPEES